MVFLRLNVVKNAYFSGNFRLLKLPDFYTSILFPLFHIFSHLAFVKTQIYHLCSTLYLDVAWNIIYMFFTKAMCNNLKQSGKRMTAFE